MSSKNNWFTTNLAERSLDNLVPFNITMSPYPIDTRFSFHENCNRSALELYETYDKLYVSYSGGLDSEFVLNTFHSLGLPITPIILDTPYNKRELEYAYKYCDNRNIKPVIINLNENETIEKFKEKTLDRGFYALLGGAPLVVCDVVNELGGMLLTGYGDPFTIVPGTQPLEAIGLKPLEFSEWDYYLDAYDPKHPSSFFSYDLGVFHSLIRDISYDTPLQIAKSDLYKLESRSKLFWREDFYAIFRELKNSDIKEYNNYASKTDILGRL